MPYQTNESIFKKRLQNAGICNDEFTRIFKSQRSKCANCHIALNRYDVIINCTNGVIQLICFDCDVLFRLDASDVQSFSEIVAIIRKSSNT